MREIRIYQPGEYYPGQLLELSPEASQHVGTVLRMRPGESLVLFCGHNKEYLAHIHAVKKKQVIVHIESVKEINRESSLSIHLAQAVSKGERMEWVVQKAVELGVASIIPIITERCVVKLDKDRMARKLHQWQSIAIAACEQSGRNSIPVIHPPMDLDQYVQAPGSTLKFVLHPGCNKTWRDYTLTQTPIELLIGPEGGLSEEEILLAIQHGFQSLTLGPRILRTETAAITALSILQALAGDL